MDGRQLVLNDGTIIPDGNAGYADGFLWLWFAGFTMQEVASMFLDPEKTSRIEYDYGDMQDVYEDFTNCTSISVSVDGNASVCMAKGVI